MGCVRMATPKHLRRLIVLAAAALGVAAGTYRPSEAPAEVAQEVEHEHEALVPSQPVRRAAKVEAVTAAPTHVPRRAADEWQGMRQDDAVAFQCGSTEHCGLARACIDGLCVGCSADAECLSSEACVLDHCVPQANVECTSRRECGVDELCMLTGYSTGPRNNDAMRAICRATSGGVEDEAEDEAPRAATYHPAPIETASIVEALKPNEENP